MRGTRPGRAAPGAADLCCGVREAVRGGNARRATVKQHLARLQRLHNTGCINDFANVLGKVKERNHPPPIMLPDVGHHLVFGVLTPELGQRGFGALNASSTWHPCCHWPTDFSSDSCASMLIQIAVYNARFSTLPSWRVFTISASKYTIGYGLPAADPARFHLLQNAVGDLRDPCRTDFYAL